MALKRIVFIRPGETDWNAVGRFQGWLDIPMNDIGRQQVKRLANFVRNIGINQLISSDLRRAEETAQIIGETLKIEPIYDERLREQHVGVWQGLTIPEMHGWYAEEYRQLLDDPDDYRMQGGESRSDVKKRVDTALKYYIKQANKNDVNVLGIVSHTTSILLMLKELVPGESFADIHFGNTSVTTVRKTDEGWEITQTNDLLHLEGLESKYMPVDMRGDKT